MDYLLLKTLHVLSATILFGTGLGTAFHMWATHLGGDPPSYVFGSAFAEVTWGTAQTGCAPAVSELLRPGTPEELAWVAEIFCGQSDLDAQFELGLALMLDGIGSPPGR